MMYPWFERARAAFVNYSERGQIPHALLLQGPSGCGKLELAMDICRELLCLDGAARGCGKCRSCNLLKTGAHPDFRDITFEIHPKSGKLRNEIIVDQIRALIEALYKTTTISPRTVAVVHPADRMNRSAANALLKTLEEPIGDTVLLLVAHDASRLPATVRSRCQRLPITLPTREVSLSWLVETQGLSPGEAEEAMAAAAGRPLEALDLLEKGELDQYRGAMKLLGLLRQGASSDGNVAAAMAEFDPSRLWTWLSLLCADALRQSLCTNGAGPDVRPLSQLQALADRNRQLTETPVRKELLLRDWLIQWKNLPATLPLDLKKQEA